MMSSSKELETEREQSRHCKGLEEEKARAEEERGRATAAEQRLECQIVFAHKLQQQVEDQEQEISQLNEVIRQNMNHIQELEQSVHQFQR